MTHDGTRRRPFGTVRRLPSGRWSARYTGPDGVRYTGQTRPVTFATPGDAEAFLDDVRARIDAGTWTPPAAAPEPRPAADEEALLGALLDRITDSLTEALKWYRRQDGATVVALRKGDDSG
jgi:hypothetical protein